MTREQEPIKIEVEDVTEEPVKAETGANIPDELRNLGKQFAETVESAWNSDERQRIEGEFREGMKNFADELNKIFGDIKESSAADRVREEATKIDGTDAAHKAKSAVAQGLNWLSSELAKLSDLLTPPEEEPAEKTPEDVS